MAELANPYLPVAACIPDGEPRVFGDRVYLYGSHDVAGTRFPCQGDYQCWSAPLNDLTQWRNEGTIYRRVQDPYIQQYLTRKIRLPFDQYLFAPDVIQIGTRWYLYYGVGMSGAGIGVAVADKPTGPFKYLGRVRYPAGEKPANWNDDQDGITDGDMALGKGQPMFTMPFGILHYHLEHYVYDPAVLYDNGRLFLYFGYEHCYVTELSTRDMRTMVKAPEIGRYVSNNLIAGRSRSGGWQMKNGASIRKIKNRYYLSYYATREKANALCYSTAPGPLGPFTYRGVLISLGDSAFHKPTAYQGSIHGGMFWTHGRYYQNYHRQTGSKFSDRQACLAELRMDQNGDFVPAKFTTQVLATGGLAWNRHFFATNACVLMDRHGKCRKRHAPFFSYRGRDQVVSNLRNGSKIGFKYLDFTNAPAKQVVQVDLLNAAHGQVEVLVDDEAVPIAVLTKEKQFCGQVCVPRGIHAIYFRFSGLRKAAFVSFRFKDNKNG